ncbi:GntR family transcriptional regulator [Aliiruegeria haliotis]|uniref:GntR family transcriptional regulator n=1 Tax=Aliiruegeria haliotis TaxID=1280846 RepID=A0A2T0RTF6_9RHOB|nr:GntR family transcriptional regulator [Aliiruegeria haliotis]PRY24448.1 GntR family transcriptional regulator [Aliiruegeria haliotis]
MSDTVNKLPLDPITRPSVTDQVFDSLHDRIVSLDLPPGTRMSELEVARALGVSRQPVRDAFFRLSRLGFLVIRPQRATTVSLISEEKVMEARFVRTALETEVVRAACARMDDAGIARLRANVAAQDAAVAADDRVSFHRLDDDFHREICDISGHPFAWTIIRENKSHLDRVRLLSLAFNQPRTLVEHREILGALAARDSDAAVERMRLHLSRLIVEIDRLRAENPDYFAPVSGARSDPA